MIPPWIQETVKAFGRQSGAGDISFGARNAVALSFENSVVIKFEYAASSLMAMVLLKTDGSAESIKTLLEATHPSAPNRFHVRGGYLERSGEFLYAVRIPEREVSIGALEAAFDELWRIALDRKGRI